MLLIYGEEKDTYRRLREEIKKEAGKTGCGYLKGWTRFYTIGHTPPLDGHLRSKFTMYWP